MNPGRIYPRGGVAPPLERKNVAKQREEKHGKSKTQIIWQNKKNRNTKNVAKQKGKKLGKSKTEPLVVI